MNEFTFIKIETLTDWLNNKGRPAEEHRRIADILSFVATRLRFPIDHPRDGATQEEIERAVQVQKMLLVPEISLLWYHPEDAIFKTVTESGGSYRVVVSKKYHGPQAYKDEPLTPVTAKPPLCLPEKTEEELRPAPEKETIFASLDERWSPAAVAERLARIDAEAAELRRQREVEDERRGFSL